MPASAPSAEKPFADTANPGGFRHIPALDGIRGLAILLVLGDHLLWGNDQASSAILRLFIALRASLWIGVNLFFALSGFLITGILWDTLGKPNFFRNFYARRSLRIFPLYYGALLTLLALTHVLHFEWNTWQWYYLTYTANLAISGMPGLGLGRVNINHFWSLQVEEQFYLVWPLIVYRVRNTQTLIRSALSACLVVLGIRTLLVIFHTHFANPYLTLSPTFSCVDNLLFGCALALLLRTEYHQKALDLAPKVFAVCLICVVLMAAADGGLNFYDSWLQQTIGLSLIGIGCTASIAMVLKPVSRTARFFDWSILRFFGKYSYGLYVYHYTLDSILTYRFRDILLRYTHSKIVATLGAAAAVGAISVLVAWLSYNLYEKHFLKLKRFFSYRQAPKPAA
jgi:peptidoglycan/LPS O-acetylase OafA/YrhL